MSHLLGLCCGKGCEDCRKGVRARLPSCLGGGEEGEEGEQQQQQQEPEQQQQQREQSTSEQAPDPEEAHPLLPLRPDALMQEPPSSSPEGASPSGAAGVGDMPKGSADDTDTSSTLSKPSPTSMDTTFSVVTLRD
ncbi:putative mediator of RNA polymerase II transcription subunit 23 [Dermacentor albipictus]|uniref:putative mediator of RNA polymerase II transcription subunit 23 n=1 Tax=Dermacentor albipictus TaxID=60249 RepID=UPI0038FCFDAA